MARTDLYAETITLPRALRFPVELRPPDGFDPELLATWPEIAGRLDYVDGRLLYMPPCGDVQQDTVTDVVITLGTWIRAHREFVLGTNEAGMHLGGATRAADAAIWRKADLGRYAGGLRRVAPVLAVEVAGDDEPETMLRTKARWYLAHGVPTVWLVLPATLELVVMTADSDTRYATGSRVPATAELPDLSPEVADLFQQISA